MSHCVRMAFWLAVMAIALNVVSSVTARKTVPMVQMKIRVVSLSNDFTVHAPIITHYIPLTDIETDPNRAPPCDPAVCVLPDCFCSEDGTTIPGDLPSKNVPQMITITFDDAINNNNINLYKEIFNGKRKNPNGCNIKATVS